MGEKGADTIDTITRGTKKQNMNDAGINIINEVEYGYLIWTALDQTNKEQGIMNKHLVNPQKRTKVMGGISKYGQATETRIAEIQKFEQTVQARYWTSELCESPKRTMQNRVRKKEHHTP